MIIKHKLTMDLADYTSNATIHTAQNDRYSRNLEFTLLENGNAWVIPQNAAVLICYSKPDGTGSTYNTMPDGSAAWQISGNILTVALAPQVLTVPGAVRLSVTLMQEQNQISTFAVIIYVEKAVSTQTEDSRSDPSGNTIAQEPAEEDIPLVFFGDALPQTKDEVIMPFRYISKTQDIRGYCKTKAQGNSSLSYPKKNQTVKLYTDAECTEKLNVHFRNWPPRNKFCFKANWIDLTHARNIVSARLWGDVVKSRSHYRDIPELLQTSPNQGAIDGFPVKVYANGIYQGRYTLNIPKDAWMANMDDTLDTHCILCGEGYHSGCFREASVGEWTDEIHDAMPGAIQNRWTQAIDFVMNSTDEEFKASLCDYFDVESLIDYHLFGLATCGLDAYGKNQLYMTYDGRKWFASMYDMDSTWGLYWNGQSFVSSSYSRTDYEDFASSASAGYGNLLYIRLEAVFAEELKERWEELKNGALSAENILSRFEHFTGIAPDTLVKEDFAESTANGAFTEIPSQTSNNIQQIRAFALARRDWTTKYLNGELTEEEDAGLLYRLEEETVFDGVDDYIDTGVKLFETPRAFTVICSATLADGVGASSGIYAALNHESGGEMACGGFSCSTHWDGSGKQIFMGRLAQSNTSDAFATVAATPIKHALVYENGVPSAVYYLADQSGELQSIHTFEKEIMYSQHSQSLVIGCGFGWWQSMQNFTAMTVHSFEIWDYAMTPDAIAKKLA